MWLQGKSAFLTTHCLMENLEYAFWTRNIPIQPTGPRMWSFGRERNIHPELEMQCTAGLTGSACIIPWAASTCPWPNRLKHLYLHIFICPLRLFLDIVYGDLCIAFFISKLSGRVIKEMHMYISPGECLCPFNKKI